LRHRAELWADNDGQFRLPLKQQGNVAGLLQLNQRLDDLAEFADGRLVSRSIGLSEGALREFEQFRQFAHLEKEAVEGRDREWLAKGPAHVLRLAGTLCLLDWAIRSTEGTPPTSIDAKYMVAAVRLIREYFWPHARTSHTGFWAGSGAPTGCNSRPHAMLQERTVHSHAPKHHRPQR
jgi:hypothetical protein